ncbi:hypothetical protein C8J46_108116 [Sphingomonas sp. PP-F2F-A104-K0414]|uniref:hypothetical protein n=1 Tax=Sphingomonas sp. PP-F2F-A104-K0414 TaxID=2135661 RepID=UPI0010503728|nr:hypothetical protein [Sphingomonas sp. PP-F2F-A104-K0414]TCP96738.1 hypothetical protein C8J46_108116 [Sphingomonas sp. PP-F2F-A104-K0414]
MPKSVTLTTGLQFGSISAGVEHFSAMLDAQDLKEPFAGADEEHIRAAYDAYCAKTGWTTPSPAATFQPVHERGPGFTTQCFGITYEDGSTGRFSMQKALSAIAG